MGSYAFWFSRVQVPNLIVGSKGFWRGMQIKRRQVKLRSIGLLGSNTYPNYKPDYCRMQVFLAWFPAGREEANNEYPTGKGD